MVWEAQEGGSELGSWLQPPAATAPPDAVRTCTHGAPVCLSVSVRAEVSEASLCLADVSFMKAQLKELLLQEAKLDPLHNKTDFLWSSRPAWSSISHIVDTALYLPWCVRIDAHWMNLETTGWSVRSGVSSPIPPSLLTPLGKLSVPAPKHQWPAISAFTIWPLIVS